MLDNLSCDETRFKLLCGCNLLHGSFNPTVTQRKLHDIFIFVMAHLFLNFRLLLNVSLEIPFRTFHESQRLTDGVIFRQNFSSVQLQ